MQNIRIRAVILFALLLTISAASRAQETAQITPEKRALIKELLELTGGTKNTNQIVDIMIQQQEKDLPRLLESFISNDKNLTPEQRATAEQKLKETIARTVGKIREVFQKINYAQIVEDISGATFDKYFNESELREWVAFYKTPLGRKTIELMPTIMSESMTKMSEVLIPVFEGEMNKIIAEETERLEKELKQAPAQPARTKRKGRA